jgi:uncharacterized protein YciI
MFVVNLTYVRPLDEVDRQLAGHRAFLARQYAAGAFLASGPKEPRTGGIILARAASKEALEAILAEDPFLVSGVAHYDIIQFSALAAAPGLESLIGI